MLLWASTRLDGLMDPAQKEAASRGPGTPARRRRLVLALPGELEAARRHAQRSRLAQRRLRHRADRLRAPRGRRPGRRPAIQRGLAWLKANQRASGRWFTRSLNDDKDHYIADAGTCFAVMALPM